jgi:hypothetical protein
MSIPSEIAERVLAASDIREEDGKYNISHLALCLTPQSMSSTGVIFLEPKIVRFQIDRLHRPLFTPG